MQYIQKFLRWLFGITSFHRTEPQELPAYDLEWTADDARILKTFLANPTGAKLLKKGRAMEAAAAIAACKGKNVPARVAGISDTFDWLASLTISVPTTVTVGTNETDSLENVGFSPEFST